MTLEVLYFAWLRERVGQPRETVTSDAATVRELVADLAARSDGHAAAFGDIAALRCAVDQQLVDLDTAIANAREVAFFPPMTGG
ncbi:molybdopterin converting factor subunit 1 [Paracoccus sp. JM45]|uniref:molybdopterin converting factor subunit 1 n=1 Tax=Paracoccus sp. JM45 TaxID=2283626 RepID=UPI000E6C8CB0|nr:molybdopterin converting factor subunit 1 [Paracoccus sp. JM45]RJE80757.1 molybdopterin converting factor subunit 1 [Paracoccus sp. JM45]